MPAPSKTYQKSSGVYYIRLFVPKHLIGFAGKSKIVYSLRTKDRHAAYVHALRISLAFENWISGMNQNDDSMYRQLKARLPNGTELDFDLNKAEEKAAYTELMGLGSIAPSSSVQAHKLEDSFERWKKSKDKTYSLGTKNNYYPKIQMFLDYALKKKVSCVEEVTYEFAEAYRDHRNEADGSPLTVDNHTKAIKQFFDGALKSAQLKTDNPFSTLYLIKRSKISEYTESYIPFRPEELERIFEVGGYFKRFKKPDLFFAPILALTMGLRLEEIAQLKVYDVRKEEGWWVIDINDHGPDKEVKTPNSIRVVALPDHVLQTNFLDYRKFIESTYGEDSHLFPYLVYTKNGYGKNIGYNFSKHKEEFIKINPELKTFHSLRKNTGNAMTIKDYSSGFKKRVLGHSFKDDVNEQVYSYKPTITFMQTQLSNLWYGVGFSAFQFKIEANKITKLITAKNKHLIRMAYLAKNKASTTKKNKSQS